MFSWVYFEWFESSLSILALDQGQSKACPLDHPVTSFGWIKPLNINNRKQTVSIGVLVAVYCHLAALPERRAIAIRGNKVVLIRPFNRSLLRLVPD